MKKFILLTRVLLKSGFGNQVYDEGSGKKSSKLKKYLIYIILTVCMLPCAGLLGYMGYAGRNMLSGLNTGIIIGFACMAGVFMSFFIGMTMCVGVFFNSGDMEFLLPMPLKAEQIVGAKFMTMYFYTFITELIFVLPIFIGYGIAGKCGVLYWLMAVMVSIILPITPLVYGSLISMVLIRVFKRAGNKDFLMVISTIFALIMVIAINVFTQSIGNADDLELVNALVTRGQSVLGVMSTVFPNTVLAEKAVSGENPLMLILFLLSAIAFIFLFIFISKYIYIKTAVEMSQTKSRSKTLNRREMSKAVRKRSKLRSYVIKEFKLAFRTPIFFMNCIMLSLIWPVFFLIPIIAGMLDSGGESAAQEGEISVSQFMSLYPEAAGGICMIIIFALTAFAVSFCMLSNTAISREGKNVMFMKYIPMSYEKQLFGKVLPGIIITLITGTVYLTIGMAVILAVFDLKIPPAAAVMSVIMSVCACVAYNFMEITFDIIKPKLNWQTEQAAVKQNVVAIVPMFIILISGALICVGGYKLAASAGLSVYTVGAGVIILLVLIGAFFCRLDLWLAGKYFPKY